MELGVYTVLYSDYSLEKTLELLSQKGIKWVELGAGGYSGVSHASPDILLNNEEKLASFLKLFQKYDISISALNCSGNPVHPQKSVALKFHEDYIKCIQLANRIGVDKVVTFSGCPGDSPNSQYQNWVTCLWPPEVFQTILDYQWNVELIPYWKKAIEVAEKFNVKVCIEPIAGFCVYNPETFYHLKNEVDSDYLGVNLDLSHLFWQGADPVAVIREFNQTIFHFHAKDTRVDMINTAKNGVLDTKHFKDGLGRSWQHHTVGYGHSVLVWKDIIRNLRLVGYEGVISIEHEDPLASREEGLDHAIKFLNDIILKDSPPQIWWA